MRIRSRSLFVVAVVSVAGISTGLHAGPLEPPAGPISSTHKTLTEVEPRIAISDANTPGDADSLFKITQPGSYYLTGNIAGVAGKHGIEIVASGVTVDLNGFNLQGTPGMGAFDGVSVSVGGISDVMVRNGSVRGWGHMGVDLTSFTPDSCSVTGIRASSNVVGIGVSFGAVTDCIAFSNSTDGLYLGGLVVARNCSAAFNGGDGISAGSGTTIVGCVSGFNVGDGIQVLSACIVSDNVCRGNGNGGDGAGIHVLLGADNRIEGNNCVGADRGIDIDTAGNIIIRNTCSGNLTNWDFVANNVYGPILDRSAPASAAVSGNSGPGSLGSTDPNANFTY